MSTTIVAVFINLLSMLLPTIGVDVGTEELTQAVQVLVAVVTGLWIWFQRVQKGDVSVVGVRH
jgi:hypothetical protein